MEKNPLLVFTQTGMVSNFDNYNEGFPTSPTKDPNHYSTTSFSSSFASNLDFIGEDEDDSDDDESEEEEQDDEEGKVHNDAACLSISPISPIKKKISRINHNSTTSFSASFASNLDFIGEDEEDEEDLGEDDDGASEIVEEEDAEPEVFSEIYELREQLGSGSYAVVKEGAHRTTGNLYAIKICQVSSMDQANLDALKIEINVLTQLNHPNIVRLYETFSERDHYYLVMEKMVGGELLDRVVQKTVYSEKDSRDTCLALFEAIQHCHSKQIAHRDLKPDNLLLSSNDSDSDVKIADFGFAKECPSTGLTTLCGTPSYMTPEILAQQAPYNTQCDMWSLGVIMYILLGGYSPFEENSQEELFVKILAGDYTFHEEFWDPVSDDAKALISALLTVDPRQRLTAAEALEHKWMTVSDDILANQDLGANLTALKRFNGKRKFRAAVTTVIATQKLSSLFSP